MVNSKFLTAALSLALLLNIVPSVLAATLTGAGGSIPDNSPTSPLTSSVTFTDSFAIDSVTIALNNLSHTFVGDLIATLTHVETGTSVDLFNRITNNNGVNPDSSNLGGTYTFSDSAPISFLTAVRSGGTNFVVPTGSYAPTGLLSAFIGESSLGTYLLTISDNAAADVGTLGSFTLTLNPAAATAVPEPATLLGLLAGCGAFARLKKRA
ncbi:PEP-CTERM sorting domain-containing protein [Anthocerotibacter panamensis]|uniref:PEP-CTERM sorting domain-containing protein n=1 Tax=Anthocerotibacter panamensis TaxID=2857077 RepID=UPI001C405BBA|nr:PEP-CTERM sorting domain-containing protein [Anthocerotibacter panamensis]